MDYEKLGKLSTEIAHVAVDALGWHVDALQEHLELEEEQPIPSQVIASVRKDIVQLRHLLDSLEAELPATP